jgi:hypothetical protein
MTEEAQNNPKKMVVVSSITGAIVGIVSLVAIGGTYLSSNNAAKAFPVIYPC